MPRTSFRILLFASCSAFFLGTSLTAQRATANPSCPEFVPPVTCLDNITRQPGDILVATIQNNMARIIGLDPDSSPSNPNTYVHAEFPADDLGDIVAIPENPREFVFTTALPETNGQMTVGKIDLCGNLVDAKFGDFTNYYTNFPPQGLTTHHGIAVNPMTGDFYVAGLAFHPQVESGPRHFTHRHFVVPANGGTAPLFYSWGWDDYGPGDSRNSGGAIFDLNGNYWQSGFGQESLSVIAGGTPYSQEYRLDYDPQNHNALGYYGLHDMVIEATNSYIFAPDLTSTVRRIDLQTRERTAWYEEDNNRIYMYITIDSADRIWMTDRAGHVLQLSNTNAPVGQLQAEYDLSSSLNGVRAIAVYGENEPTVRETCE